MVPLPSGKKAIGSKWVYKIKLKSDGTLERHKARLVAKGYNQLHGIDFQESFSPVVRMTTASCLIVVAVSRNWQLFQLDVNNDFLHGDLHEDVFMQVPEGMHCLTNMICKLKKSLYGLRQASRQWFSKLTIELFHQGYTQSKNDYSVFTKQTPTSITILAIYVDDIIITGNNSSLIQSTKTHLHKIFGIKDLGKLNYFLGFEVIYVPDGLVLSQCKFATDLLHEFGLDSFKKVVTPLPINLKLQSNDSPLYSYLTLYRSIIGKLNFLTSTRPDLSFATQSLS